MFAHLAVVRGVPRGVRFRCLPSDERQSVKPLAARAGRGGRAGILRCPPQLCWPGSARSSFIYTTPRTRRMFRRGLRSPASAVVCGPPLPRHGRPLKPQRRLRAAQLLRSPRTTLQRSESKARGAAEQPPPLRSLLARHGSDPDARPKSRSVGPPAEAPFALKSAPT